jgi:hypothetical protein
MSDNVRGLWQQYPDRESPYFRPKVAALKGNSGMSGSLW